jgi:hypothetical protein
MTISIDVNTIPGHVDITSPPGSSVSYLSTHQMVFDTSDATSTSSGLYIWKSGAFGAQNWLRKA